jgi:ABC-type dipeptide/oligopeptide/nickel transport system permease subunit
VTVRLLSVPPWLGVVLVCSLVVAAALADVLWASDPIAIVPRDRFLAPALAHPFGTDQLGRDLLARMLHGGRIALFVAAISIATSLIIGILLGLLAGYGPRSLDHALLLVFDAIRSFPTVMQALALATVLGPSLATVILVVVLFVVEITAGFAVPRIADQYRGLTERLFLGSVLAWIFAISVYLVRHRLPAPGPSTSDRPADEPSPSPGS